MIVGAGPAGVSTWLHLKKYAPALADHAVLIDKAVFPRDKLCGGAVWPWSEAILHRLAIDISVPALFLSDVEFRFREQRWRYQSRDPFRMVQRIDFDQALVASARHRGMVLHENEAFIAVERSEDTLVVMTSQAQYGVKALVGADGALSRVRHAVMRPHRSCLAPAIQVSAPVDPRHDTEFARKIMRIDFSPVDEGLQGYVWHFPCLQGGRPYMNHGIGDFRLIPDRPKADMQRIFRRELQARHIDRAHGAWSSYPLRWLADQSPVACTNVILAGDAAGIDPALGGGIHMALSFGDVAARALVQAFKHQDYSFRRYKQDLMSTPLGQDIRDFTLLAHKLYGGRENPLNQVREFFTERLIRNKLQSLLRSQQRGG